MHEEEVLGKAYDARLMRRLLLYLRPYWRSVLLALVAILASAAVQLLPPWLTLQVIDVYIRRLRKKIEQDPSRPRFLESVRGSGYKFNAAVAG